MAKYSSANVEIQVDDSSGSLVDMSNYIREFNGFDVEAMVEDGHAFGDSWVEQLFSGLRKANDITIKGQYDDTATTGPNVMFNDVGNTGSSGAGTRTLKVTWGNSKYTQVEVWIKSYRRLPSVGKLTEYEVVLSPSGAVTEG